MNYSKGDIVYWEGFIFVSTQISLGHVQDICREKIQIFWEDIKLPCWYNPDDVETNRHLRLYPQDNYKELYDLFS